VSGIYVAGDLAGIEEASTAMEEGRLAALSVVAALGKASREAVDELKGDIFKRLDLLRSGFFGRFRREGKDAIEREYADQRS
jgi:hypothetical protein